MTPDLLERLEFLLDKRRFKKRSARGVSLAAGLSGGYLNALLTRLRAGVDAGMGANESFAIAKQLEVEPTWLVNGLGVGPQGWADRAPWPTRTVALDDQYPNRAAAIAAFQARIDERVLGPVRDMSNSSGDLPTSAWIAIIEDHLKKIDDQAPAIEDDEPPSNGTRETPEQLADRALKERQEKRRGRA